MVQRSEVPFWLAGKPATSDQSLTIRYPYDHSMVATVAMPDDRQVEQAITAAVHATRPMAELPAYVRAAALDHVVAVLSHRADDVAELIMEESGKPIKWARIEVTRAISTFRWAAEEARRFSGDLQRLDTDPVAAGRMAVVRRFPRGPILGITPFNFPLNLVAHKIAPAIAVGAPIVVKPAPRTPLSALLLAELLAETELPPGALSVLPIDNDRAPALAADPRLPVVSFTGSATVGWQLREALPRKHVTLELGGNAAVIVADDYPDLNWAAERIATFANYQAGQSCIAVQRVYIAQSNYDDMVNRILAATRALNMGDPRDELTDVGPLIDDAAAERVDRWVAEAVAAGAEVLVGGTRTGTSYTPTVVARVPSDAALSCEEVFAPVLTVAPYQSLDEAFALVNQGRYGLQAGVFTRDLPTAFAAHQQLAVGGVIIGDVPSYRADQMPYGGVKDSGTGREGVRSAMDDYTEPRTLVLTGLAL